MPRSFRLSAAIALLLFVRTGPIGAQAWVPIGPEGGQAPWLARDPSDLSRAWLSTARIGVLRSVDGGRSWTVSNEGLPAAAARVTQAISRLPDGSLLLGTFLAGLYRSVDGGLHWSPAGGAVAGASIDSIAADPRLPGTVYAAGSGLFQSRDGGLTWAALPHPGNVYSPVSVDPTTSRVYAGQFRACPFASSDLGATWTALACYRTTSPFVLSSPSATAFLPDPSSPATVYVAAADSRFVRESVPGGVFRSDDAGATFTEISIPGASSVNSLVFGPGGSLWAGTSAGLYVSQDRGTSWQAAAGFPALDVRDVRAGPGPEMLAGTLYRGVFASHDGGATWQPSNRGLRASRIQAVALDPQTPSTIWAGSADFGGGLFVSGNGGADWADLFSFPSFLRVDALGIDPFFSDRVLAAGSFEVPGISTFGNLYESADRGSHWDRRDLFVPFGGIAFDPRSPSRVLAGGFSLNESNDSGATWNLLVGESLGGPLFDPENPLRAYTSTHWSGDGGHAWIPRDFPMPPVSRVAVAPGGVVYAGTASGVWRSDSFGLSFRAVNFGIEDRTVLALAVDRARNTVYAGMMASSSSPGAANVFESRDGGTTWLPISDGLPPGEDILALAPDPTSGAVFAGTLGGVYRRIEGSAGSCVANAATLCLGNGRFRAQVSFKAGSAPEGGRAIPLTRDAGAFWFFSANNVELVVKVVDGRAANGRFWVFGAGLTDVEYDLAITDTTTGAVWTRRNATGNLASFADTTAF